MKELWEIFISFFKIGCFTFGGGLAMLPLMERELVDYRHWVTKDELLDFFAVGQVLPGIIAVNTATLVGHKRRGFPGSLAGDLGVITPSIFIILVIASILQNITHLTAVQHAFAGIRVAVCALIAAAVIRLLRNNLISKPQNGKTSLPAMLKANALPILLCLASFVCIALLGISPIYVVVGAAAVGLLFFRKREVV